jgi:cell division septum initiation protein DivIVA
VDQALAELRDRVDSLAADRDRLSEQKNELASRLLAAVRRANELDMRVKHLSASAESADGLSERIRAILGLASAEADAMTTQARKLLEQATTSQAELDRRGAEHDAEHKQVLAAGRAEADQLREEALEAASARRAEAHAEAERILDEARTSAKAVVDEAHRGVGEAERVAIRCSLGDSIRADHTTCASLVVHDKGLAGLRREALREHTRHDVVGPARGKGHHEAYGSGRVCRRGLSM